MSLFFSSFRGLISEGFVFFRRGPSPPFPHLLCFPCLYTYALVLIPPFLVRGLPSAFLRKRFFWRFFTYDQGLLLGGSSFFFLIAGFFFHAPSLRLLGCGWAPLFFFGTLGCPYFPPFFPPPKHRFPRLPIAFFFSWPFVGVHRETSSFFSLLFVDAPSFLFGARFFPQTSFSFFFSYRL